MLYQIKGFENYSITQNGEVFNNKTGKRKAIFQNKKNKYFYVDLWKQNRSHKIPIHRLIAETFIPNPENKPTVDHKNGDRTDNSIQNLRWATYSEQNSRFNTIGIRSEKIVAIHQDGARINFDRIKDAAEYFHCTLGNISQMLKIGTFGKRSKTRYYKFEYEQN